jgi:membrane-bound ClpP family serine protease
MNLFLALLGAVVGLFVTGAGIYTAWTVHQLWRQQAAAPRAVSQVDIAVTYFSRWTIIDYSVVGLFLIGLLLMLAELVAVGRDHTEIANFHWAYLLTGIIMSVMGMLLLFLRLVVVLSFLPTDTLQRTSAITPNHQHEPNDANHAK